MAILGATPPAQSVRDRPRRQGSDTAPAANLPNGHESHEEDNEPLVKLVAVYESNMISHQLCRKEIGVGRAGVAERFEVGETPEAARDAFRPSSCGLGCLSPGLHEQSITSS